MKLPKSLITVTPLSKLVALILFILLPILAFYYGMYYQRKISEPTEKEIYFMQAETPIK